MKRLTIGVLAALLAGASMPCEAASLQDRPIVRRAAVTSSANVIQRAERGDADAQARLGYMYELGRVVPQNYRLAVYWYGRAAQQGHSGAQYLLSFMFDRGFGVPPDHIEAHKWMNLAAATASNRRDAEVYTRMRNAIASKLTRSEVDEAQLRASAWVQVREY